VLILADFSHHFRTDFSERFIADFSFTGFGASNYFWDFGDNSSSMAINPSHFFPDDDTYRIELIVNSGMPHFCYDTVVKTITVEPPFNVYVPNAFTPNGDGINDFFRVVATRVKTYHIYIYNRWGELLFESQNMEEMWGGLYRMEKVPQDVYTYFIEVVGENDKKYSTAGTVVLYR
jgi:gliding motility-associated-like protein